MTYNAHPFQLLEINVISGQDLAPVSKSMRTYAVVWVHPGRKLSTKVDQNGHTNPQWNEKIVFRVDDTFINAENSSIMIEIYAAAWLRDVQIGSVNVLISNLFPSHNNSNKMRFVALQVRRPSGRPQGILNLGVQLLDSTMRSMPLYTELSVSAVGLDDSIDAKTIGQSLEEKSAKLRRSQSDQTDQTISDKSGIKESGARSHGGSLINSKTVKRDNGNGNGSMINGSLCSDVGPSASVVAAAIAKGLIKTPANAVQHDTEGGKSSVLEDWTENDSIEGLRTKLERWRADLPPNHDSDLRKMQSKSLRKKYRRRTDGGGLFTCFGFGCEISITWGKGNNKKRNGNGKVCHVSSVDSQSYL
ncbi:hypothetical protein OIU84_017820 [Salix udensis]|uniref:C2 domain-containing protein n=1 Tax=Salix udensis TaxID=889485 RepID=A0AAD6L2T7_9ROSI|nr:hypothetical protein OIU84_017820 [Salix udensis]